MYSSVQKLFFYGFIIGSLFYAFSFNKSNQQSTPYNSNSYFSKNDNLITPPSQPEEGPGGSEYLHEEVKQYDFAEYTDGFWLYEPAAPKPVEAPVLVFVHGYGAYNPMIYGKWIKHLVKKGNTVIFPRYQRNLMSPKPDRFSTNVAIAIRDALGILKKEDHVNPKSGAISLIGHSYGGVISADLAMNFEKFNIPKPDFVLACSPGTGPLSGGRFESYESIPEDIKLVVTISEHDRTVGEEFGWLLYKTATQVKDRTLVRQFSDYHGEPGITAHHNEAYSVDQDFDSGVENFSTKRANNLGRMNAVDYFAYWKFADALMDCCRMNENCDFALGNTEQQRNMGTWSDGQAIKKLEVHVPE